MGAGCSRRAEMVGVHLFGLPWLCGGLGGCLDGVPTPEYPAESERLGCPRGCAAGARVPPVPPGLGGPGGTPPRDSAYSRPSTPAGVSIPQRQDRGGRCLPVVVGYWVPPYVDSRPNRLIGLQPLAGLPALIELGSSSWLEVSDMVATHPDRGLRDVTQGEVFMVITLCRDTVG